jgi:hypothetical protein
MNRVVAANPWTAKLCGFSITYEKTEENLFIASSFRARKGLDETRRVSFPKFLSLAWSAANAKARELGWII